MSGTSLRDFVSRTVEHKRIRFGDLRRLRALTAPWLVPHRSRREPRQRQRQGRQPDHHGSSDERVPPRGLASSFLCS